MKWKDLSLKERKQIYDSVRVNNPDATYFDIKEQFDSIPEYGDGKDGYTPEERAWVARRTVELGMEGKPAPQDSLYTIVDRAKVQNKPKKYDPTDSAIEQGKQVLSGLNKTVGTALTGASLATMGVWNAARLLNIGKGSSWRLAAAENALTGSKAGLAADVGNFIEDPSITNAIQVGLSKVGSKDLTTASNKIVNTISSGFDFDDLTKVPAYQDGKGKTINKADLPPEYRTGTPEYFERQRKISGAVNTVQPEAYITPVGYIKDAVNFIEDLGKGDYAGAAMDAVLNLIPWGVGKGIKKLKSKVGRIVEGTEKDNVLPTDINDYNIVLDNNIYMPGTANHELGHVADGLAGSRKIQDFDSGKEYITNTYLNYLANSNNTYSSAELRKMGLFDAAGSRSYLLNPTEAKSHMLTLKRSLKDSGKITNWSTPVDENMILEYMRNPTSNKMVKNQYDLYRNKNEYIDRLNKLIPMEILMPLGGAGFVGHELNKE